MSRTPAARQRRGLCALLLLLALLPSRQPRTFAAPGQASGPPDLSVFLSKRLEGTVTGVRRYGLFVDVKHPDGGPAACGLLPAAGIMGGGNLERRFEEGQALVVRVAALDERGYLQLETAERTGGRQAKVLPEEARPEVKTEDVQDFEEVLAEKWLTGVVTAVKAHGLDVDVAHPVSGVHAIGKVPAHYMAGGLMSAEQLSATYDVGQEVRVRVMGCNKKVTLSMMEPVDWQAFSQVPKDAWLAAVVSSVQNFGVFVDAAHPDSGRPARGLVPVSKVPSNKLPVAQHFAPGQEISVQLWKVDAAREQLDFSMTMGDLSSFSEVPKDQWLPAFVNGASQFGLHVDVEDPQSGRFARALVHIREVSRDFMNEEDLLKKYRVGEEVSVRVLTADADTLTLSMLGEDWQALLQVPEDARLTAVVANVQDFGLFVDAAHPDTGRPVRGLVPMAGVPGSKKPLTRHFEVGQEVPVQVASIDKDAGQVTFSMPIEEDFSAFSEVPKDEWLPAVVDGLAKSGLFLDVEHPDSGVSARTYVHMSQTAKSFVGPRELREMFRVGQTVRVRVLNCTRERLTVTMVDGAEEEVVDLSAFKEVPSDQWLKGTVDRVADSGLHVKVELPQSGKSADGYVHISEVSADFMSSEQLQQEFHAGQELKVRVLEVAAEMLSLSLKQYEEAEVDAAAFQNISPETPLAGKVVKVLPYGLKVRVSKPPGQGLVHASRVQRSLLPTVDHFEVGQDISVWFHRIDKEGRLEFSADPSYDFRAFLDVPKDQSLTAFVKSVDEEVGLIVEVEHPDTGKTAAGQVHVRSMAAHPIPPQERFELGQRVSVQIFRVDEERGLLNLDMGRDVSAFLDWPEDQWLAGSISEVAPYGLHVELVHPDSSKGAAGLVHVSNKARGDFQVGQTVQVRVLSVDVKRKHLELTMKEIVDYAALARVPKDAWHPATVVKSLNERVALVEALVAGQSVAGLLPAANARHIPRVGKEVRVQVSKVSPKEKRVWFASLAADASEKAAAASEKAAAADTSEKAAAADASEKAGALDLGGLAQDVCEVLRLYEETLVEQGYESVATLRQLSREEWMEMRAACKLRPGHAAKLRGALHPEWA